MIPPKQIILHEEKNMRRVAYIDEHVVEIRDEYESVKDKKGWQSLNVSGKVVLTKDIIKIAEELVK